MIYVVVKQQQKIQLKIICLKFVKFYTFRNLSLKISRESSKNLDEKSLFCFPKNSVPRISLILLYNEDKNMSFTKQEKIGMSLTYCFQN